MAKRSILAEGEEATEINLSSMIDCIFILLIFFIVTTVFVEESGLQVNKPDAAAASANNDDSVSVALEITANNKIMIDGQEIPLSQVKNRVKDGMVDADTPVMIRSHERASHGLFISVWDEASQAGANQLSYTTTN
ncbi:ExbD/TolR family protein [Cerasicoccus fimbriatus]|uniref:ExbD/TolR family protein n=1 Tax=Cerasicoccus fimbriatus TaxID=3014554 RepID=UPI0022B32CC4|nr:biopolymer transporter ExbD [Cerasicoccus sp. TK19100]